MKKAFFLLVFILPCSFLFAQTNSDMYNNALENYNQKNYHKCIEQIDDYLKTDSTSGNAYYFKSLSKLCLGDIKNSFRDFQSGEKYGVKNIPNYGQVSKFIHFLGDDQFKLDFLHDHYYKGIPLSPENGYRPIYTREDSLRGSLRPERTCFDVTFYDLAIKIKLCSKKISGENKIYFKVVQPTKKIQIDLFDRYTIEQISWNNHNLSYSREYDAIFIDFPETLPTGSLQVISIKYSGKPQKALNPPWEGGFVW